MQEGWLFFFQFEWKYDSTFWKLKELLFESKYLNRSVIDNNKTEFDILATKIELPRYLYFREVVQAFVISKTYKPFNFSRHTLLEEKVENLARKLNSRFGVFCLNNLFTEDEDLLKRLDLIKQLGSEIHQKIIANKEKHVFLDCLLDDESGTLKSEYVLYGEEEIEVERYKFVHFDVIKYNRSPCSHTWIDAFWVYITLRFSNTEEIWRLKQKILFNQV